MTNIKRFLQNLSFYLRSTILKPKRLSEKCRSPLVVEPLVQVAFLSEGLLSRLKQQRRQLLQQLEDSLLEQHQLNLHQLVLDSRLELLRLVHHLHLELLRLQHLLLELLRLVPHLLLELLRLLLHRTLALLRRAGGILLRAAPRRRVVVAPGPHVNVHLPAPPAAHHQPVRKPAPDSRDSPRLPELQRACPRLAPKTPLIPSRTESRYVMRAVFERLSALSGREATLLWPCALHRSPPLPESRLLL